MKSSRRDSSMAWTPCSDGRPVSVSVPVPHVRCAPLILLVALLASAVVPASARAQWLKGIVLDEFSGGPVKGADVALVADGSKVVARAMTGDDGRFTMTIPKFGGYHLEVSGLGYAPFSTRVFFADSVQQVSAQVSLAPEAIKLEGLEVTTTATERKLRLSGFYVREAKHVGYFITPQDMHDKVVNRITDAFYGIPGLTVRRYMSSTTGGNDGWDLVTNSGETKFLVGGRCYPSIAIDGTIVRHGGRAGGSAHDVEVGDWYHLVDPNDVAAIEVYPTAAGAPVQMMGQESPCGAVLIWTRDR